ncbi:MAG TPA: HAMP domain-containing sensor histidine kinase [Gaiellaceae bacterium]|jgi:signal transduction histidine kinase|nr:HAMP domain-containing sensor histidine kinase [Gaiellaceae bacterium]
MFRSLRFRVPALFLVGVVVSGLIAAVIALRLFQGYVQSRLTSELRRDAVGLTELYQEQANKANGAAPGFAAPKLEKATGARLYFVGESPFPGSTPLRVLPRTYLPNWQSNKQLTFEFTPPGLHRRYVGVANPLRLSAGKHQGLQFGDLVVAKPKTELNRTLLTLVDRLAIAFIGGIVTAGLLAWYLSRRITKPVLALSDAADAVARGQYDVDIPEVRSRDEIGHLAERFREMAARLAEAEQLERNFLMSVSHELRTPLTAIRGHVDALREGVADDPELRAASLDVIAAESARLERLVGDVLDLAKLDAHRFTVLNEEVDMGRLCEQAYGAFAEEARRRSIEYRQRIDAAPTIVSDGDRVLQIISNLLSNAFRWTPDGGTVDLELGAENGTVSVAVDDSGPGIPASEQDRIFRPFWSQDHTGTGLGLAIAHELAVALGGRIELESQLGRGSRFELVLPVGR